jgi:hypothetical protein
MDDAFASAPIKQEGQPVFEYELNKSLKVETTYVERRVPVFLEEAAHKLIDQFLADHGYKEL